MTTTETGILTRAAVFQPQTFDEEQNSIEVVFSSGAEVLRHDFEGPYSERLDLAPESVNLTELRGAHVLDNHNRFGSVGSILGVVEDARVDGNRGVARIRFGKRPEIQGIVADIRGGVIRSVSTGYRVEQWRSDKKADGSRVKTAIRWTPVEVSFVPLPADPAARTRSIEERDSTMEHAQQIRSVAEAVGVPGTFAEGLIQRGETLERARAEIIREAARLMPVIDNRQPTTRTEAAPDEFARAAGDALCTRVDASHEVPEMGRPFTGRRLPDIARELLRIRGLSTFGSDAEVITRSLHTTSDLANVVGVFANKVLAQRYQAVPGGVKRVCRRGTSHADFRGRNVIRLGELPQLEKVNEKGEFKRGAVLDSRESYAVATYGKVFGMSRQLLINDDLGALADIAAGWGLAAAEFENSHLADVLTANTGGGPKLADGVNLFHATHGNLATGGADPEITYIADARLALRRMKGLSGTTPINVEPRYILIPAALETKTETILAEIYPAQSEDVNVFSKRFEVVVDPRLDAKSEKAWYLFADPAIVPVIEYAYLSGYEGVQIETRNGFDVDGIEVRARLDFGAGGVDFRGAFRNPGLAA